MDYLQGAQRPASRQLYWKRGSFIWEFSKVPSSY